MPAVPTNVNTSGRLGGKRVLITGTGRGQGAAAQQLFCQNGATVVGCDVLAGTAEATASVLREQNLAAFGSTADLADPAAAREWVAEGVAKMGGLDVLYNNAGAPAFAPFAQMTLAQWRFTIVNELEIVFLVTSAAWPYLATEGGNIINTASISALHGSETLGTAAHSAAKGGILGLTKQLAAEGARTGIRVNVISPGLVDTPGTAGVPQQIKDQVIDSHLLRRTATPHDIANCAVYLASDESSFVTGAEFMVDGGFCAV